MEDYVNDGEIWGIVFSAESAAKEFLIPYAAAGAILGLSLIHI